MQMMTECPDVLFGEVSVPAAMSGVGARMEAVEDEPAGPWLGVFLNSIGVTKLSEWDLPAYLRLSGKHQAWAASLVSEGVIEIASRPGGFGADKEVALALREPVGAARRRIWVAQRLCRLPTLRRLFRAGMVSSRHIEQFVEATARVHDGELLAKVEDKVLTGDGALARTATELRRAARRALIRLDPAGALSRARAARENADVTITPLEDGMALTVIEAPVEQGSSSRPRATPTPRRAKRPATRGGWGCSGQRGCRGSVGTTSPAPPPSAVGREPVGSRSRSGSSWGWTPH
jgi:hypothetical protein